MSAVKEERYVRRDDPTELVKVVSRERSPNGFTYFEFILPNHHQGRRGNLPHGDFEKAYKPEYEPTPEPPTKPVSTGSRDEWRAWALYCERKWDEAQRNYERLCTHDRW
jgi:hypothetical protein